MPVRLDHKTLLRIQQRYFPPSPSIFKSNPVLGDLSERDPPVPIPNTEVKPLSPDGTARASVWESRTSPELNTKSPELIPRGFCVVGRALALQ